MNSQNRIWPGAATLCIAAVIWSTGMGVAAEAPKADPTGTWKLVTINPESKVKSPERTLKLKLEGEKLTGTLDGKSQANGKTKAFEWPIKDAKIKGNEISFTLSHAPVAGNGPESTTFYQARLTNDTMKGTAETEWNGNKHKRPIEARRVKQ